MHIRLCPWSCWKKQPARPVGSEMVINLGGARNGKGPEAGASGPLSSNLPVADQAASGFASFSTVRFMRALSGASASFVTLTDSSCSLVVSVIRASNDCLR